MDSPAIAQHMFPSSPSPVSRVTGFVVATAAQSKRSPRVFAREPSLLSLNLASSSFGSSKVADTESEGSECTEHLDSDFEDDFACPAGRGIPIVQRWALWQFIGAFQGSRAARANTLNFAVINWHSHASAQAAL